MIRKYFGAADVNVAHFVKTQLSGSGFPKPLILHVKKKAADLSVSGFFRM